MKIISDLLSESLINAMGWTILHTLWQGILLAIFTGLLLRILNHKSSQLKYIISLTSLFLIVGLAIFNYSSNYYKGGLSKENELITFSETNGVLNPQSAEPGNLVEVNHNEKLIKIFLSRIDKLSEYFPVMVGLWFIGLLIFLIRFLFSYLFISRLKRASKQPIQENWITIFENIKSNLKLKKTIRYIESTLVKVPMVLGYLKPVILIPAEMLTGIPSNQIEAVIAHELAHIRRNDYIINVLQTLIETVFFFHPAVWYLSSKIRNERENCCDDIALTVCDGSLVYAKALVSVQDFRMRKQYAAVAFSGRKKHLLNRIKRMIMKPKGKSNFTDKIIAATIILSAILALSFTYKAEKPNTLFENSLFKDIPAKQVENAKPAVPTEPLQPEVPTQPSIVEEVAPPEIIAVKDTTKGLHIRGEQYNIDNNTISKVTREKDGKKEEMKFTLKNGKVTELYVDGKKVPESEYGKYQSEVDEIIDDLKDAKVDIREAIQNIENIDFEEMQLEIQEAMKNVHIDMKAAQEEIKRAMEDAGMVDVEEIMKNVEVELKELDELHDMNFDIDLGGESFHFDMADLDIDKIREQVEKAREEINEQVDMEEIQKEMMKAQEELSKINEEEIRIQMQESAKHFEEFDKQETINDLQKQLEELENLELEEK